MSVQVEGSGPDVFVMLDQPHAFALP